MADVKYAIIADSDWWDGTTSWAGEANETARDAEYDGTYPSLQAWETARDGAAQSVDDEYAVIIGPWASADSRVNFVSWSNSPTIHVECPITLNDSTTNPARGNGIYGDVANSYRLEDTDDYAFDAIISLEFHIDGLQIGYTYSSANGGCLYLYGDENKYVTNCVSDVTTSSSGYGMYLRDNSGGSTATEVKNCVVYGHGSNASGRGILAYSNVPTQIVNCTVSGSVFAHGIWANSGGVVTTNCAVFNTPNDFEEPSNQTITYCASDDGDDDGADGIDWNNDTDGDWTENFNDWANGDFTPLSASGADLPIDGAGQTNGDNSNVPTIDILGVSREAGSGNNCTIGAFEYAAAGTASPSPRSNITGPIVGPLGGVI